MTSAAAARRHHDPSLRLDLAAGEIDARAEVVMARAARTFDLAAPSATRRRAVRR